MSFETTHLLSLNLRSLSGKDQSTFLFLFFKLIKDLYDMKIKIWLIGFISTLWFYFSFSSQHEQSLSAFNVFNPLTAWNLSR